MVSIGIRTTPKEVFYTIINTDRNEAIIDSLRIPAALEFPEQLKYLRSTFLDIINEQEVEIGCIRVSESIAQNPSLVRCGIEGVLQELIASSTLKRYKIGRVTNISSLLDMDKDEFKEMAEGRKVFKELDFWPSLSKEHRESYMAAECVVNLN